MVMASAACSSPSLALSPLGSEAWAIKDTVVTDDELKTLAGRSDLVIREVDAPLSKVSTEVLQLFLRTHGLNLERFKIQNNTIDGAALAGLAVMMPHLKTLSFQYLHNVKDEDLLRVVETCEELETLRICQNRRITKAALYQILGFDRRFLELSIDIAGRSNKASGVGGDDLEIKAQVEVLRLSGPVFESCDLGIIDKIKGLRDVELILTHATPESIASLSEGQFAVTVKDISTKRLAALDETFRNKDIPFERQGNTIRIHQGASEGC